MSSLWHYLHGELHLPRRRSPSRAYGRAGVLLVPARPTLDDR